MPMKRKKKLAELDLDAIPAWLDPEAWSDFFQNRIDLGEPMTELAAKRMIAKIGRMHANGDDVLASIEQSIIKGWTDLYPVRDNQQSTMPQRGQQFLGSTADARLGESMEDYQRRKQQEAGPKRLFH